MELQREVGNDATDPCIRDASRKDHMTKTAHTLADKFDLAEERVLLTGSQAAVRMMLMQHERDRRAGLRTGGLITGYRGSPIAGLEGQARRAAKELAAADILFQPGLNEDLAATALWGSQQAELRGEGRFDGVIGLWYGKGPGVDRAGDALRHANHAGTSKHGGVVALMGDDHTCESSTTAHQSEYAFADAMIPILNPGGVQEILDYGILGFALSRFAGTWVGIKCVKDNIEATAVCDGRTDRVEVRLPDDYAPPEGGLGIRLLDTPLEREARLHDHKRDAVLAFARANKLDKLVWRGGPSPRIGIISTGKSYLDTRQALEELGIDEVRAADLGIRLYKVAMTWPLEPQGLYTFAEGLDLIVVVEEKRSLVEVQCKEELYGRPGAPQIIGKYDESRNWLFQAKGSLQPTDIAMKIGERVLRYCDDAALKARLGELKRVVGNAPVAREVAQRIPYFCAGCPHNTSTVVPKGSRAYAGIGCHFMSQWMDRQTLGYTHMGGEGAQWIGEAPFSKTPHVFQNLGDGTYVHSGSLAVRAAIAAGVNITYKILYNDAVAMTGGQPLDGGKTVQQIAAEMIAEGARRVEVVSDDPDRYLGKPPFPSGVKIHPRGELDGVQRELREVPGVTVLIYDQTCAAEKRRRRKRGTYPDPDKRVLINPEVCEGCGDCGTQSNCVAILPLETDLGRKRQIDQSNCNKDFSCLKGFCPSFVTIEGARLRKPAEKTLPAGLEARAAQLPEPALPGLERPYQLLITGVGGTGVVTVSAVLGEAAFLDGKGFGGIEMTGLAQKGGAVSCHTRIARDPSEIHAIRTSLGGADAVLGGDLVVTASRKVLETFARGHTRAVVNGFEMITGDFARNPKLQLPTRRLHQAIEDRAGEGQVTWLDAHAISEALFGDSIASNMILLGLAYQLGMIPIRAAAIEKAIELNRAAVEMNRQAFRVGRLLAVDRSAVELAAHVAEAPPPDTLESLIDRRAKALTAYQNAAYAERFRNRIAGVAAAEQKVAPGSEALARAAAEGLYKLMAYKDEYEVARLFTDGSFERMLGDKLESHGRITYHMAPPFLAGTDPATGRPAKRSYGPWLGRMLKLMASLKGLRGTAFDPFGRSAERRMERRLVKRQEDILDEIALKLTPANHAGAVELAGLPLEMKGYGPVKAANVEKAEARQERLLAALREKPSFDRPTLRAAE